ncbi:unnamed protein product, partial [Adineta steineri]
MNNFDCSMEVKQQSLSLPSSSSSPSFIPNVLNTNDSIMTIVPFAPCHHQSNINAESEDLFEIARQKKFNLTIPSEHEEPRRKLQLKRKAFAIVCRSNMTSQYIEFGEFRSLALRAGGKWSKKFRDEQKQMREIKAYIENAMQLANTQISFESQYGKNA